ncbi:MAG: hypothetical protein KDC90_20245, partial [Ignavibacteriae bacterium]|nr:hypothetical protein [Ignavibacteriota bacterium]
MRANHEGNKCLISSSLIKIERGSFLTSQKKLAEEFKCSRKRISTFLNLLKDDQMIDMEGNTRYTVITICNYSTYQDKGTTEAQLKNSSGTAEEHLEHSKGTAVEQPRNTNKNVKNDKNINNVKNEKKLINEGWKERSDDITQLWIECFARFPTLIEQKETKSLINKYGIDLVKKEFHESVINGGKSLRYIIN